MARPMDRIETTGGVTRYFLSRREVSEAEYRAVYPEPECGGGVPGGHGLGCWPMASDAAAVHPSRVEEARESARAKGVPTDFDQHGRPVFRDRGHRRAYLRAYGYHDRDGGYGD